MQQGDIVNVKGVSSNLDRFAVAVSEKVNIQATRYKEYFVKWDCYSVIMDGKTNQCYKLNYARLDDQTRVMASTLEMYGLSPEDLVDWEMRIKIQDRCWKCV